MPTQHQVMKLPAVAKMTTLSRATIYRRMIEGTFPKPIPLGTRGVGWLQAEVDEWIASRIAERGSDATEEG